MNQKGFSSVELLVSFVIISFVAIAMFNTVLDLTDRIDNLEGLSKFTIATGSITNSVQKDLVQKRLYGINSCGTNCYEIVYQDLSTKRLITNIAKNTIQYGKIVQRLPDTIVINGNTSIVQITVPESAGKYNTILKISIPLKENINNHTSYLNITYQYDNRDMGNLPTFEETSMGGSANAPVLATGMVPVKWNGSAWVDTTADDSDWYSYAAIYKKWANARTADGSMWVWIPRYAYQISDGYQTNSAGTINVKFLVGQSNIASDGSEVATTPTYSGSSQTNYIKHPAFSFGSTELTGFWVAKFETSGSGTSLDSKPNATSYGNLSIANMFTYTRGMETNSRYGWGTSGSNLDTHMMKNTEWGLVAYLSKSIYGKNNEIGLNNNSNYTTGCGAAPGTGESSSCNTYDTATGMQASTTGNIYGIYDMSGGKWEYVMGNYNNLAGNSGLTPSSIDNKYIDRYNTTNYGYNNSIFGDAVYETSYNAYVGDGVSGVSPNSWYHDDSSMPYSTYGNTWFRRGGRYPDTNNCGAFGFHTGAGDAHVYHTWRIVIAVQSGL